MLLDTIAYIIPNASAFSAAPAPNVPLFTDNQTRQRLTPSTVDNVEIELPDFDELFRRIREVSPLACMVIEGEEGGFAVADEKCKFRKEY